MDIEEAQALGDAGEPQEVRKGDRGNPPPSQTAGESNKTINAEMNSIIEELETAEEVLAQEGIENRRARRGHAAVARALSALLALQSKIPQGRNATNGLEEISSGIDKKLRKMEQTMIDKFKSIGKEMIETTAQQTAQLLGGEPQEEHTRNAATGKASLTWAKVAAKQMGNTTPNTLRSRPAIRAKLNEQANVEESASELLARVKPAIPTALAVRKLQSGDIDIYVKDQATKDYILRQTQHEGLKVLRQDYILEVPGVPRSIQVASGPQANNSELIQSIKQSTIGINTNTEITAVRWLHEATTQKKWCEEEGCQQPNHRHRTPRSNGTLLIYCATQAVQQGLIRSGIVIEAQFFETRLFENSILIRQCFRCGQWGHTQSACGRQAKCSRCAGEHDTRTCQETQLVCLNCGGKHAAWHKRACRVYTAYLEATQRKKALLWVESERIRSEPGDIPSPISSEEYQIVTGKRRRTSPLDSTSSSGGIQSKRPVGRPTFLSQAARQPGQTRFNIIGTGMPTQMLSQAHRPASAQLGTDSEPSQETGSLVYSSNE